MAIWGERGRDMSHQLHGWCRKTRVTCLCSARCFLQCQLALQASWSTRIVMTRGMEPRAVRGEVVMQP